MQTLNQVKKIFSDIATAHRQINSFGFGDTSDINVSGTTHYPLMYVVPEPSSVSGGLFKYTFKIIFADLVHTDCSNRDEVLSDIQSVALDVISQLTDPDYEFSLETEVTLEDFTEGFDDNTTGWIASPITLNYAFNYDRCAIPSTDVTIGTSSCPAVTILNSSGVVVATVTAGGTYTVSDQITADFTADDTSIDTGATVQFTDLTNNSPTEWYWEFEGGTPATSTAQNPSVVFNTAGTKDVFLMAAKYGAGDIITKSNYITVTESFTPATIPGLLLWLEADMGITLNGSTVSAWADQSGQGNHATQATGGIQPEFIASAINSKPVVRFASTKSLSITGSGASLKALHSGTGVTYITLFKRNDALTTNNTLLCTNNATGANVGVFYTQRSGRVDGFISNGVDAVINAQLTYDATSYGIFVSKYQTQSGDDYYSRKNNGSYTQYAELLTPSSANSTFNVFIGNTPTAQGLGLNGDIVGKLIYNSFLSDANILLLTNYLNTKYAIF